MIFLRMSAVLIAAAFIVIGLTPLARTHFRQPTLWVMVAIGAFAFPIAQWVNRTGWDPLAFSVGLPQAGAWLALNLFVWALVAEAFKFAPVLIVGAMTEAPPRDWFIYGAAAGAGFGFFGAQQVIGYALEVSRLPLSTWWSVVLAIFLRLFPILAHIATTAFVGWAAPRGWLGRGLLAATTAHLLLGLVERGQGAIGTLLGNLLFAFVALFLFLYAWTLRDQAVPRPSRLQAG
ncbi:MAG: hypothetical protein HY334_00035 [Armatimonadetes bacterium]|nr:hypothetical protein [Armatimonadota bacterium]